MNKFKVIILYQYKVILKFSNEIFNKITTILKFKSFPLFKKLYLPTRDDHQYVPLD